MGLYRLKPRPVDAWQWIPGDLAAAGTVVGTLLATDVDFHHPSGSGPTTTLQIGTQVAQPNDWIVRSMTGEWTIVPAAEFALDYEPVRPRRGTPLQSTGYTTAQLLGAKQDQADEINEALQTAMEPR
ncbi:hypothetical protein ABZ883_04750 [Streptomyces sp. NPDC046977]|uniref:hypothetical protein n=1 Tax=Streptomyces sp. NPDC046977 TaxID=3154703 RepID=UPI00340D7A87